MKKIITIIVLMLITSIGVYAEEPADRSADVLIYEVIPSSFLWESSIVISTLFVYKIYLVYINILLIFLCKKF